MLILISTYLVVTLSYRVDHGNFWSIGEGGNGPDCCGPEHRAPFHSVTIDPNDQAAVWLTLRVTGNAGPYAACHGLSLDHAVVSYRVFGLPRQQDLALNTKIQFVSPC